jgi:multidrug efflux pump subunit AcrB
LQLDPIVFQPNDVQEVIDSFVSNLIQAVVVVMGAMLLFLGLRTGLVISALIPTTMMATLLVMNVSGIGLDQISLAALIIALGMLVDNGVVMAESIVVRMSGGMSGKEAAIQSSRELRVPLLTASLTTSAAFLPIFLAESATGEYTASLFTVVTIALLASWLLSLTMTPMLCATFLRVEASPEESTYDSPIYRSYRRLLEGLLHRRWLTLAGVVLVFVATMSIARFIPALFFPSSDRPSFEVEIELPPGTDIEYTRHVVQELEGFLVEELMVREGRDSGILDWGSFIGRGGPRYYLSYGPEPSNPAYAILLVSTTSHEARDDAIARIRSHFWENHPEVLANAHPRRLGPPVSHPVQIRLIAGPSGESLFSIVDDVKARLRQIPTTRNVGDDWGLRTRKITITVDQARARNVGATSKDVTMRSEEEGRLNFDVLTAANIYVEATGRAVPLSQIASGQIVWEPSKILRRNGSRAVSVIADVAPGTLASDVMAEIVPWIEETASSWPLGTRFEIGGEDEASSKANASIGAKLPLGAGIIVLLLVMQFNSFRKPAIVLLTVPLGLIGVVLGLLVARSYFGFMTFLGVISLFGIVINNAIVLIDRIQLEMDENDLSAADAILVAAQARLRPILLTTGTTILGLVPLYLGGGPMWEPMAVAIMSGLAFATVLTLGVVPVLYSAFYRVRFSRAERP